MIHFESDCLSLVQDVLSTSPVAGWQVEDWLPGIRSFFSTHPHHSRKQNKLAHCLAKWAATAAGYGFLPLSAIPAHVYRCHRFLLLVVFTVSREKKKKKKKEDRQKRVLEIAESKARV